MSNLLINVGYINTRLNNPMRLYMFHDVPTNNVFEKLACYASEGHRPVVSLFEDR